MRQRPYQSSCCGSAKKRSVAGLQRSHDLPNELVVDAEIGELSAERVGSGTYPSPPPAAS
jgi:hypothetical protein